MHTAHQLDRISRENMERLQILDGRIKEHLGRIEIMVNRVVNCLNRFQALLWLYFLFLVYQSTLRLSVMIFVVLGGVLGGLGVLGLLAPTPG